MSIHNVFAGLYFYLISRVSEFRVYVIYLLSFQAFALHISTALYNDTNVPFFFKSLTIPLRCIRPKHTFTITTMNAKLSTHYTRVYCTSGPMTYY